MADYGIRISKAGVDVKTGADKDMILNTKHPLLKGRQSISGTVTVHSGVEAVVTLGHNLGYIPFVQVFFNDPATIPADRWYLAPFGAGAGAEYLYVYSRADSTNVYITFDWFRAGGGSENFKYKAYIFLDKGK